MHRLTVFFISMLFCLFFSSAFGLSLFVEPNDGITPVLQAINTAHTSIDMPMYLLSDHVIMHALSAAQKRGVQVRVILEKKPYGVNPKKIMAVKKTLTASGVPVHWSDAKRFDFTHEKAIVIDHKIALIMTLNQTYGAYHFNREFGIVDSNPNEVNEIERVFDADWHQQWVHVHQHNLVWAPNDAEKQLRRLLLHAKQSVLIEIEEINDFALQKLLVQKAKVGVIVKILLPPQQYADNVNYLKAHGVQVRILNPKKNHLYLHAKMIVVDGRDAFVGSENLTRHSLHHNRELGIVFSQKDVVLRLVKTFERDWAAVKVR